jgi:hypothetical protein
MGKERLPKGFRAVDRTTLRGALESMSPAAKSLQAIMVRDERHTSSSQVDAQSKPDVRKIKKLSDVISSNIQASNDLRSITHYIKRAEQIYLTLLLKPNGDQKQLLRFDTESSDIKNEKLHDGLLQIVKNYFTVKYPFEELLPQIIKDVLFRTGSYALLNLSHSALDHLINGQEITGNESATLETVFKNHFAGSLDKAKNIGYIRKEKVKGTHVGGLESLYAKGPDAGEEYSLVHKDLNWTFTDNPMVLKMSELKQTITSDRIQARTGFETLDTVFSNVFTTSKGAKNKPNNNNVGVAKTSDLNEALREIYPQRRYRHQETISIRRSRFYTGTGRGIGITYHIPSESIIPVHVNGEIGQPFGFILLTDPDTGEFLKTSGDVRFYQGTKDASKGRDGAPAQGSLNEMVSHLKMVSQGGDCNFDMEWMVELSSAQLEKEYVEGILNGDLQRSVSITLTEHNKKLFLSRAMRQQGVRSIFIPAEYITYFSTDFTHLGIGKSLVEDAKLQITRLAILDTADILANIENSISKTELEIGLEKENFDPRHVVAIARDQYFANNPTLHDIVGYNNVSIDTVIDRFKEQSLIIKVNPGENKNIVAPTFDARQAQHEPLKTIDKALRDGLLDGIAGHFGLKRSWLEDTGEGNEFAIEALADQELLRNQTAAYSRDFSRMSSDFMRKNMRMNEPLLIEMIEHVKENKKLYDKPDQGGQLKTVLADKENEDGGDNKTDDRALVETVLLDFLNNFYVELPQPIVVDTLNKIENKMDSINKLVTAWMEMSGAALAKEAAVKLGVDSARLEAQVKGMYTYEAFKRFNLPMPFEEILNDGDGGGLASLVNGIVNLDGNMVKFFKAYMDGDKKIKKEWDKLIEKYANDGSGDTQVDDQSGNELVEPSETGFLSGGNETDPFANETLPGEPVVEEDEVEEEPKVETEEEETPPDDVTGDELPVDE